MCYFGYVFEIRVGLLFFFNVLNRLLDNDIWISRCSWIVIRTVWPNIWTNNYIRKIVSILKLGSDEYSDARHATHVALPALSSSSPDIFTKLQYSQIAGCRWIESIRANSMDHDFNQVSNSNWRHQHSANAGDRPFNWLYQGPAFTHI